METLHIAIFGAGKKIVSAGPGNGNIRTPLNNDVKEAIQLAAQHHLQIKIILADYHFHWNDPTAEYTDAKISTKPELEPENIFSVDDVVYMDYSELKHPDHHITIVRGNTSEDLKLAFDYKSHDIRYGNEPIIFVDYMNQPHISAFMTYLETFTLEHHWFCLLTSEIAPCPIVGLVNDYISLKESSSTDIKTTYLRPSYSYFQMEKMPDALPVVERQYILKWYADVCQRIAEYLLAGFIDGESQMVHANWIMNLGTNQMRQFIEYWGLYVQGPDGRRIDRLPEDEFLINGQYRKVVTDTLVRTTAQFVLNNNFSRAREPDAWYQASTWIQIYETIRKAYPEESKESSLESKESSLESKESSLESKESSLESKESKVLPPPAERDHRAEREAKNYAKIRPAGRFEDVEEVLLVQPPTVKVEHRDAGREEKKDVVEKKDSRAERDHRDAGREEKKDVVEKKDSRAERDHRDAGREEKKSPEAKEKSPEGAAVRPPDKTPAKKIEPIKLPKRFHINAKT